MVISKIGFIGLGVMGEPMCRNLARKCGVPVTAYDLNPEPLARAAEDGVQTATSMAGLVAAADVVFLSLPGGEQLETVCRGKDGLLAHVHNGQTIVDTSTSPVTLTRELATAFQEKGVAYADAPIARTRQAAQDGTLSIMVGASDALFARLKPLLDFMGSDVAHCGDVGCGQIVKTLNNMVLMETVQALSEALSIGQRAGMDGEVLFKTLMNGSADSFALRNHGMKAMLPGVFPEKAFSVDYALKDMSYALGLAEETGVDASGARNAETSLRKAQALGHGDKYWPVIIKAIDEDH
jgi:3-hydroxyisobutyrate dehydrogenase-like beta-hydroxyacid dehydrogenase